MPVLSRLEQVLLLILNIATISGLLINYGYQKRTNEAMRKTVHELNAWKQNLFNELDNRFIRKDLFVERWNSLCEKFEMLAASIDEVKDNMERRRR